MKFKYKKSPRETGKFACYRDNRTTDVYLNGKVVAAFYYSGTGKKKQEVRIGLVTVKEVTPESTCPWKWTFLKYRPETEPEAREFFEKNCDILFSKFNIYKEMSYQK